MYITEQLKWNHLGSQSLRLSSYDLGGEIMFSGLSTKVEGFDYVEGDGEIDNDLSKVFSRCYHDKNDDSKGIKHRSYSPAVDRSRLGVKYGKESLFNLDVFKYSSREWNSRIKVTQSNAKRSKRRKRRMIDSCLLYTSPSPRDRTRSRMPSSA